MRLTLFSALVAGLCVGTGCGAPTPADRLTSPTSPASSADRAIAVRVALSADNPEVGRITPAERDALTRLYEPRAFAPLWTDAQGQPTGNATTAAALLAGAADEGLNPADYRVASVATVTSGNSVVPTAREAATFDVSVSLGMLRYLRHLHAGRVDPRTIGFRDLVPADDHDYAALLRTAVEQHTIAATVAGLAPPLVLYRGLRTMLARYRRLAAAPEPTWPVPPVRPVKPGEPYAGLTALRQRLVSVGNLSASVPEPTAASRYDGPTVDGVKTFQVQHGMADDGVLGRETLAALAVPQARRVRQIELALERLRWLPHLGDEPFLAVNIPMFRLWGWKEVPPSGVPSFTTSVIVGRSLDTQTPVFVEEMRYIIFRPYWNVPASIATKEIVPALAQDPGYLSKNDMEIVDGQGDDARPVAATADAVARVRRGALRVRQRPGPHNSLGLVKFVFPNDENVYMHDTPAGRLFRQSRRDFSHGCVRVEDPVALAQWALADQPDWTKARILAAMQGQAPLRVDMTRPLRVILFYVTAVVMPEDGTIRFADDIYGHDARLDRALQDRAPTR